MTRRIPSALGIVVVFAAIHGLYSITPMVAMAALDDFDIPTIVWLFVGGAAAQLVTGIAILVGARHARLALLAWTTISLAMVILARDSFMTDATPAGLVAAYVEALAGPALVWIVPLLVGERPPVPAIPTARVVSSTADAAIATPPRPSRTARRFDVGVLFLGVGITTILGTVLNQLQFAAAIVHADEVSLELLPSILFLAHPIIAGALALRAGRRLLDPGVDARRARRAVLLYLIVAIGGDLVRVVLTFGIPTLTDSEANSMLITSVTVNFVLGLITPGFLWWYLRGALADAAGTEVVAPARSELARIPAWAVLWFVPVLLSRPLVMHAIDIRGESVAMFRWVVTACVIQGIAHLVAGISALVARAGNAGARRIARIAAIAALVNACGLIAAWGVVAFASDAFPNMNAPIGPVVQMIAATTTLWWLLRRA